jgi:4-alpha-glucanotransferase
MKLRRKSGILLHPTSLPGGHGIGDLGKWAYRFVDFLAESGQRLWQVLPLGPPGFGNSPYQCYSSMAGNPLLISLDLLSDEGWISRSELELDAVGGGPVDFGQVVPLKWKFLRQAARTFFAKAPEARHEEFRWFCNDKKAWLDEFAAFAARKDANGGVSWTEWREGVDPDPEEIGIQKYVQFEFFRQWRSLRKYCRDRSIEIIGDMPIFVAHDSADVWANPQLFDLDADGHPRTIAGVPPDYFSATGQCWGNPLYRWDGLKKTGYLWWIQRVQSMLDLVDITRVDHFRGFEKYYEIPGGARTAVDGRWVEGPGDQLFAALEKIFGRLPFIAEDLGLITPEVHALRERWGFPGMRVLQFAFGNDDPLDAFKPYNFVPNCVVYTGTHDNDTTRGWFTAAGAGDSTLSAEQMRLERNRALSYLNSDGSEIHWDFIRAALASVADTAIFPMQDVLGLGSEARMNLPATAEGNWQWRLNEDQIRPELSSRLRQMCRTYGRLAGDP